LQSGTRLGPYEILSAIGAGGMGEVYRARDTKLGRDVAIKVLPEIFAADPERRARFQREAQVLASLNHPHIAAIYGLEDASGVTALAMELVEGDDLAQRLARGPIPLDETLAIAMQFAEALEAAHDQGIVHRDLKPANIKVRTDGTVKVLDFGLAKLTEAPGAPSSLNVTQSPTLTSPVGVTAAGMILGTAAYMSPEQAKGRAADKRCDVWAFGCVLYEMLAGRRPFDGETIAETLAFVLTKDPDWTALPADTPAPVGRLLRRCLEKDPRRRLRDIGDALHELRDALSPDRAGERVTSAGAPTSGRRRWLGAAAIFAAIAAASAVAAVVAWRIKPSPAMPVSHFAVALPQDQLFSGTLGRVLAISRDGNRIAYVANNQIFSRAMSDAAMQPIPGTASQRPRGAVTFALSPDGEFIVLATDDVLKKLPVKGGASTTICACADVAPGSLAWDPTGISFVTAGGIMRVSPDGGTPQRIVAIDAREWVSGAQMLPDGRTMMFAVRKRRDDIVARWDEGEIVVQATPSGPRRTLIPNATDAQYVPSGHIVYAAGGSLMAAPFDAARQQLLGPAVAMLEGIGTSTTTNFPHFQVSDNGSLIYIAGASNSVSGRRFRLVTVNETGAVSVLPPPEGGYEFPRVSPDSARLTFDVDDGKDADVWVYDISGASAMRRLTFGGRNRHPIWSRDGHWIAFQSDRDGDRGIFRQRADGTGAAERLTTAMTGTSHVPQSWSPTGDWLLFSSNTGGLLDAWTGARNPGQKSTLMLLKMKDRTTASFPNGQSTDRAANGEFSPDGAWIAYSVGVEPSVVYVQPFPANGAVYQISKDDDGHHPWWSHDGRALFYVPGPDGLARVTVTPRPTFSFGTVQSRPRGGLFESPITSRSIDSTRDDTTVIGIALSSVIKSGNAVKPQIDVILNWSEELKRLAPRAR
jgi:serine/threonine-protein kinase